MIVTAKESVCNIFVVLQSSEFRKELSLKAINDKSSNLFHKNVLLLLKCWWSHGFILLFGLLQSPGSSLTAQRVVFSAD